MSGSGPASRAEGIGLRWAAPTSRAEHERRDLRWAVLACLGLLALTPAACAPEGTDAGGRERPDTIATAPGPGEGAVTRGPEKGQEEVDPVEAEVMEVVSRFKGALAEGDSAGALAQLHPGVRVYEAGHAETLQEYRSGHLAADMAFTGAVETRVEWEDLLLTDGMALYLSEYTVRGTFRDREVDGRGTETMVLVPGEEGWRIRHIHWSSH